MKRVEQRTVATSVAVLALLSLLLLVVGCSSGSDSGDISFGHVTRRVGQPEDDRVDGHREAIDNDLFCPAANGTFERYEDEDGATRTSEEIQALIRAEEPIRACLVDGHVTMVLESSRSGSTPYLNSDWTWTITGGAGYDSTSGEGGIELPLDDEDVGDLLVYTRYRRYHQRLTSTRPYRHLCALAG